MFPCYLSPLMYSSVIALLPATSQPATSHYSLPWASYQQIFLRLHETFLASNPTQVSTWVEELGSCWSLLGSSKTKSWDLSEGLGGAAEHLPWVSAAERDFCACFLLLSPAYSSKPVLWCTLNDFPPKVFPTWHHGRLRTSWHAQPSSVLCHLPAGPHHHHPAVLFE